MATRRDFILDKGSTFTAVLTIDLDGDDVLSNYSPRASFKKRYMAEDSYPIETSIDGSTLTLRIDADTTAELTPGRYVYDVEIYQGDFVYRVLEGSIEITPRVTGE